MYTQAIKDRVEKEARHVGAASDEYRFSDELSEDISVTVTLDGELEAHVVQSRKAGRKSGNAEVDALPLSSNPQKAVAAVKAATEAYIQKPGVTQGYVNDIQKHPVGWSEGKIREITFQANALARTHDDCQDCHAHGKVTCGRCRGSATENCGTCRGGGILTCRTCGGDGKDTCGGCGGRGQRLQYHRDGNYYVTCGSCGGGCRTWGCYGCGGKGQVYCGTCGGHGEVGCGNCGATGAVTCRPCGGHGVFTTTYNGVAKSKMKRDIRATGSTEETWKHMSPVYGELAKDPCFKPKVDKIEGKGGGKVSATLTFKVPFAALTLHVPGDSYRIRAYGVGSNWGPKPPAFLDNLVTKRLRWLEKTSGSGAAAAVKELNAFQLGQELVGLALNTKKDYKLETSIFYRGLLTQKMADAMLAQIKRFLAEALKVPQRVFWRRFVLLFVGAMAAAALFGPAVFGEPFTLMLGKAMYPYRADFALEETAALSAAIAAGAAVVFTLLASLLYKRASRNWLRKIAGDQATMGAKFGRAAKASMVTAWVLGTVTIFGIQELPDMLRGAVAVQMSTIDTP